MSHAPSKFQAPSATEDSYSVAKNALVSSLCQLSTAATQTATAAINFYKVVGVVGVEAANASASLQSLSDSVRAVANTASVFANGSAEPKKAAPKAETKKETPAVASVATPAIAAPEATYKKITRFASLPSSSGSSSDNFDTHLDESDPLSTTDPALVRVAAEAAAAAAAEEFEKAEKTKKAEKAEKAKKKRAEKDPFAPKKPLTSYLRFNLAVREQLKKERDENGQPTLQATELNQIIADKWANLGEAAKSDLQKAYESEYEVYKKVLEEYKKKKDSEALSNSLSNAVVAPVRTEEPKFVSTSPVTETAPSTPATPATPAMSIGKSKKKKKSAKKHAEPAEPNNIEVEDIAVAATEAALAENAQKSPKASKKRKEKDSGEKSSKKKKLEQ